jgi:hypothetical protein
LLARERGRTISKLHFHNRPYVFHDWRATVRNHDVRSPVSGDELVVRRAPRILLAHVRRDSRRVEGHLRLQR